MSEDKEEKQENQDQVPIINTTPYVFQFETLISVFYPFRQHVVFSQRDSGIFFFSKIIFVLLLACNFARTAAALSYLPRI